MRTIKTLIFGAALALTGSACGGADDGGAIASPTVDVTADADVIGTTSNTFEPAELTVSVGDEVTWAWTDAGPLGGHNVVADDESFDSGEATPEGSFSFTFTEAGEFPYYCEVHGAAGGVNMAGTITVE